MRRDLNSNFKNKTNTDEMSLYYMELFSFFCCAVDQVASALVHTT